MFSLLERARTCKTPTAAQCESPSFQAHLETQPKELRQHPRNTNAGSSPIKQIKDTGQAVPGKPVGPIPPATPGTLSSSWGKGTHPAHPAQTAHPPPVILHRLLILLLHSLRTTSLVPSLHPLRAFRLPRRAQWKDFSIKCRTFCCAKVCARIPTALTSPKSSCELSLDWFSKAL